jgi:hypothetical protein
LFHLCVVNESNLADMLIRFESVEVVFNYNYLCSEHLEVVKAFCRKCTTHSKTGNEYRDSYLVINMIQTIANWDAVLEILKQFPRDAIAALGRCIASLNDDKIVRFLLSLK